MGVDRKTTPAPIAADESGEGARAGTRRAFLTGVLGLCVVPLAGAACRGRSDELSCVDMDGLSNSDKATRSSVLYKDWSIYADKTCANCIFYQPPPESGGCGECRIVRGPIHPKGYCTGWIAKSGESGA